MEDFVSLLIFFGFILVCAYLARAYRQADNQNTNSGLSTKKKKAQSAAVIREQIPNLPRASVKWVIDGDTVIAIRDYREIKIRLDSIDCPENDQHWGDAAKFGLMKLISKQWIHIEEHGVDHYGRTLATIYVWHEQKSEWLNVNERMVMLGHAWVLRMSYDHLPQDRQSKLNQLEKWSRSKSIGIWSAENPQPPWKWRKED